MLPSLTPGSDSPKLRRREERVRRQKQEEAEMIARRRQQAVGLALVTLRSNHPVDDSQNNPCDQSDARECKPFHVAVKPPGDDSQN
jgi:hypothetical protein